MKRTIFCTVLFVCLCFGSLSAQTYNTIRMAYFHVGSGSIPSGFYERAKANGFNYILAEFVLEEYSPAWDSGRYYGNANSTLRKQLKDEFLAADIYRLKLIPLFQTSSQYAGHWRNVKNDSIQWQTLPTDIPIPDTTRERVNKTVPTFAPDPPGVFGFDSSYNQLLKAIYDAFDDARASTPPLSYSNLDYIHFGADEPIFELDTNNVYRVFLMAGLCQRDRDWITKNTSYGVNGSARAQNRIIALLGSNIKRKVEMIRAAGQAKGHMTTALYYTDMLDPNHFGGSNPFLCTFTNLSNTTSSNTTNIKTYSLACSSYIQAVKNQSIAVQWNYDKEYAGKDYDTDSTFRYFKANGLKFLHGNALADEANPINGSRFHQLMEQAVVSTNPKFNNYAQGFVSFHWCSGTNLFNNAKGRYNQRPSYMTMEFLSHILWHNAALYE